VFRKVAQQVLEYLHVPHDLPLAPQHKLLLASAKAGDKDLEEGTPDHPGEPLETAEVNGDSSEPASVRPGVAQPLLRQAQKALSAANAAAHGHIVQAAMREGELGHEFPVGSKGQALQPTDPSAMDAAAAQTTLPISGTVVLDVEQGGIEVPSFVGKTVRAAVESAEDSGLQLEAVGSGVGQQQSPPAGTHVAAGSRVTVQFGR
jgi:cell division protein FtsI (penicillin-binding protein 3)